MLGWSEAQFWASTPTAFWIAYDGWARANSPSKSGKSKTFEPLTPEEEAERERLLRLVPDGRPPRLKNKGAKTRKISGDMLASILNYNGIEFKDGRSSSR